MVVLFYFFCDFTKGLVLTPPTETVLFPFSLDRSEGLTMHWILAGDCKQWAKHGLNLQPIAFTCRAERPLTFLLSTVCANARCDIAGPSARRAVEARAATAGSLLRDVSDSMQQCSRLTQFGRREKTSGGGGDESVFVC